MKRTRNATGLTAKLRKLQKGGKTRVPLEQRNYLHPTAAAVGIRLSYRTMPKGDVLVTRVG